MPTNIVNRRLNRLGILSQMATKTNIGPQKESSTWDDGNVTKTKSD